MVFRDCLITLITVQGQLNVDLLLDLAVLVSGGLDADLGVVVAVVHVAIVHVATLAAAVARAAGPTASAVLAAAASVSLLRRRGAVVAAGTSGSAVLSRSAVRARAVPRAGNPACLAPRPVVAVVLAVPADLDVRVRRLVPDSSAR